MPGPTVLVHVAARDAYDGISAMTSARTNRRLRALPTSRLTREQGHRYVKVADRCLREPLLPAMPDEPRLERSLVQSGQALCHRRPQQWGVRDREQVLRDEPHLFVGRHPVEMVEAREVHRPRERAQRSLPPKIEVRVEIAHGQLS